MVRIDVLPDDVLLEIFGFYMIITRSQWDIDSGNKTAIEAWQSLVHVCQRWRSVVLGAPRHLNLQLCCTPNTPARDTLDVWPALPLIVDGDMASSGTDNLVAVLGQSNRVCEVRLWGGGDRQVEEVMAPMQVSFPELTLLVFSSLNSATPPVIPDTFLGGSAPRLRFLGLNSILFPGIPKLLSSTTRLDSLTLFNIPHSGYISPEAMVTLLCALSNLETLSLGFRSPESRPDLEIRSLPPPKRSILPALRDFYFKGVTEYLEDLVTFIDAPRLDTLWITFFNQIDFDCPRLAQFIRRTPEFGACDNLEAHVKFDFFTAKVDYRYGTSKQRFYDPSISLAISCTEPDWQLSFIEHVCNSSLHPPSTIVDLYIEHEHIRQVWRNDAIENTLRLWLQLLLPFTTVENLYLSKEFAPSLVAALQELIEGTITEVLPSLQKIFVEGLESSGPLHKKIERFVAARQLSGHPIAVSVWDKDPNMQPM